MKYFIFLLLLVSGNVMAQSVGHFRYDTVIVEKIGGNGELVVRNSTRDSLGIMVNMGNGRTEFRKVKRINDSTFIFGRDTVEIKGGAAGTGTVTNFTAGTLSPLFTTSVATATTTPALTFSLSNAGAYTLLGRGASIGAPSFLSSIDSNWIPALHSEAYYNTKYGSTGWGLTGNAITAGTNFLGTTNNTSLRFRTNNTEKWRIDSTGDLKASTDGTYNIGDSNVNRPNKVYIKSSLYLGNSQTTWANNASKSNIYIVDTALVSGNNEYKGIVVAKTAYKTSAPTGDGSMFGGEFEARIGAANTVSWTNSYGQVGVRASKNIQPGATGTVTFSAGLFATGDIAGMTTTNHHGLFVESPYMHGGTITNNYGVYIQNPIAGSTLNYSIYSEGGLNQFGGNITLTQNVNGSSSIKALNSGTSTGSIAGLLAGEALSGGKYMAMNYINNSYTTDGMYIPNTGILEADNTGGLTLAAVNGSGAINIYTGGYASGNKRWTVTAAGHFIAGTDNSYDIGASLATRPRTIYVGTNGIFGGKLAVGVSSAAASSIVDLTSTTTGFLPPRMTTVQMNAISSPAEGLTVYDLTAHKLMVYDGTTWQACW